MHIRIVKIKCLSRFSISKYSQLPSDLKRIPLNRKGSKRNLTDSDCWTASVQQEIR